MERVGVGFVYVCTLKNKKYKLRNYMGNHRNERKYIMKITILDTATFGNDIDLSDFNKLGEVTSYEYSSQEEAAERLANDNPDVVIVNKVIMDAKMMSQAPALKMVAETATGFNNIDLKYAAEHGIRVANVPAYSTKAVVQHTFALCFYVLEKLSYYDEYVKSGEYQKSRVFTHLAKVFPELDGKTWGIIGLGAIGREVAKVATAFGCRVIAYSASGGTYNSEYEQVNFDMLLKESDILSIHAPLNEYTKNLMNYDAFCRMKKSSVLINVGRGPIVNEADLVRALNEEEISGAGLDVLSEEPMAADNPLNAIKDSSRLIITPHIAWAPYETRCRLLHEVYENIAAFSRGEERNCVRVN